MLRVQGYKFEALPNGEQLRNLLRFAGSCRFVYNQALALNKQRYENKEKRLGYAGMCALLPSWKTAHPWLSDAPSQALQQSLKDLERAFTNFFNKRADFPDFHKKGRKDSKSTAPTGVSRCQRLAGCATASHEALQADRRT